MYMYTGGVGVYSSSHRLVVVVDTPHNFSLIVARRSPRRCSLCFLGGLAPINDVVTISISNNDIQSSLEKLKLLSSSGSTLHFSATFVSMRCFVNPPMFFKTLLVCLLSGSLSHVMAQAQDVVLVSNYDDLSTALSAGSGNVSIALVCDISLEKTLTISQFEEKVYLDGRGFSLDATGSSIRCIYMYDTHVTMHNLTIVGGNANDGLGGAAVTLFTISSSGSTTLIATHCLFSNNNSTQSSSNNDNYDVTYGGALFIGLRSSVQISSSVFSGNEADSGGAIYVYDKTSTVKIASSLFSDNVASSYGGGIYATSGTIDISDCSFLRNEANIGGGGIALKTDKAILTTSNAHFTSNRGGRYGGALWVSAATANLKLSKFTLNSAGSGGGIYSMSGGQLKLEFLNISHNTASASAGGVHVCGNSKAYLVNCDVQHNLVPAPGGKGGGLYAVNGGRFIIQESRIMHNVAGAPFVRLNSGPCTVSGDCFYSPHYPSTLPSEESCSFDVIADDIKLKVITFDVDSSSFSCSLSVGDTSYSGMYVSDGPSGVSVVNGEIIEYIGPELEISGNFEICQEQTSDGGGIFIQDTDSKLILETSTVNSNSAARGGGIFVGNFAKASVSSSSIESNSAAQQGGAIVLETAFLNVSSVQMLDNEVLSPSAEGSAVYIYSGSLTGLDLVVNGNFGGEFANASAYCGSSCPEGTFGQCSPANGAQHCLANCGSCPLCPVGSFSAILGAVQPETCSPCGPGTASLIEGSTQCELCEAGRYSGINDTTGGLKTQVLSGATACLPCPSGTFTSTPGSIVCEDCPTRLDSIAGSSSCKLAAKKFYIDPVTGESTECPAHSKCIGGWYLPQPRKGYYIERGDALYAGEVYKCYRDSCTSEYSNMSCWIDQGNGSAAKNCHTDKLICAHGSRGPLCNACDEEFVYDTPLQKCRPCEDTHWGLFVVTAVVLCTASVWTWAVLRGKASVPTWLLKSWLGGIAREVDTGTIRICVSTYQIVNSISWGSTSFPEPFNTIEAILSVFSFDFLSTDCFTKNHLQSVVLWSMAPIIVVLGNGLVCGLRFMIDKTRREKLMRFHMYIFLLVTYLVTPPVTFLQFQALKCIEVAGASYLEFDTSINCSSSDYKSFLVLNVIFITAYLTVPLIWLTLLWRKRDRMNPFLSNRKYSLHMRDTDPGLAPYIFLFKPFEIDYYFLEPLEMMRRIFMVAVVPLTSSVVGQTAAAGMAAALCSLTFYGQVQVFANFKNGLLIHIAQYAVLLNYAVCLVITSGLYDISSDNEDSSVDISSIDDNVDDADSTEDSNQLLLGVTLVAVNLVVLGLAFFFGLRGHLEKAQWQVRELTPNEERIVEAVMMGQPDNFSSERCESNASDQSLLLASEGDSGALQLSVSSEATPGQKSRQSTSNTGTRAFQQLLLDPKDVTLEKRIGVGAFGEVFHGFYAGQPVAIKTLHKINEQSMQSFRKEMITHHALRHPNVVTMVGACWSKELVALLLEWVPRGSLGDLLQKNRRNKILPTFGFAPDERLSEVNQVKTWDLYLRLAQDVARGMVYLHSRDYIDERSGQRQRCVMHRDLKPDNVLITEFSSAKLADFGVSRSKAQPGEADSQMTLVGTPLYAAPELMNGSPYDESADVYSFGMLLLDLVVPDGLVKFIGDQWRFYLSRFKDEDDRQPDASMRGAMRASWHDGWRPYSTGETANAMPEFQLPCERSIAELVAACCAQDSRQRPTFERVLGALRDIAPADAFGLESSVFSQRSDTPLTQRARPSSARNKANGSDLRQPLLEATP